MVQFTKKNKKIILSSSMFIGINSNIYCVCCKGKKCSGEKPNTTSENNDLTTKTGNPDTQKNQNPPTQKPPKSEFQLKKEQILQKIEELRKLCPGCKGKSSVDGKSYEQNYLGELNKIHKDINDLLDDKNITSLKFFELSINSVEKNIKGTLKLLLKNDNDLKIFELVKEIKKIKDKAIKDEISEDIKKLENENKNSENVENAEKVKNSLMELAKKIEDQLNKEDSSRKKRNNVLNLLKTLEDLKVKTIGEIRDLEVTEKQINDAKTIEQLNAFENTLKTKEKDINNIIDYNNTICKDQKEFSDSFRKRKVEIADIFFTNDEFKNKLKNNNPADDEIKEYYQMYHDMTNDVFNHQVALDLQIYRYILKFEGFTTALDNIFKKTVKYYFTGYWENSNKRVSFYTDIKGNKYTLDKFKDECDIDSGLFTVDDNKFQFVRCKGCKDINCISCKLKGLLTDENILKKFTDIYENNGWGIINPNVTVKRDIMWLNRIIYCGLKKDFQGKKYYIIDNKEVNFNLFKEDLTHDFIKCVMIEWALTIEFMKRFIPNYYNGSNEFYLYRTFKPKYGSDFIDLKSINDNFYDCTSLIAPSFIPQDLCGYKEQIKLCSFTQTVQPVKFYKCYYNHIISPNEKCILKDDNEHEIGFIGIKKNDNEVIYERISSKAGDDYLQDYINFLDKRRTENEKKNLK